MSKHSYYTCKKNFLCFQHHITHSLSWHYHLCIRIVALIRDKFSLDDVDDSIDDCATWKFLVYRLPATWFQFCYFFILKAHIPMTVLLMTLQHPISAFELYEIGDNFHALFRLVSSSRDRFIDNDVYFPILLLHFFFFGNFVFIFCFCGDKVCTHELNEWMSK